MPYPDWRAERDCENVGAIEQIGVGEACNRPGERLFLHTGVSVVDGQMSCARIWRRRWLARMQPGVSQALPRHLRRGAGDPRLCQCRADRGGGGLRGASRLMLTPVSSRA
jgi:hypothetical protein